jgi:hypothetical protein
MAQSIVAMCVILTSNRIDWRLYYTEEELRALKLRIEMHRLLGRQLLASAKIESIHFRLKKYMIFSWAYGS